MVQRIQTLYLLIVTILQIILFFSSIAQITPAGGGEAIIFKTTNYWAMAVITAITAILAFFTIFLFRRRVIQIRINIYNLILLLALQGYLVYYLIQLTRKADAISYSIPAVFPLVSAILTFLAIRGIGKDEALIRAMDRIR